MPSSIDPLFVKFDGMGYVSEVFFVEIAGPILDKLGKHSCVSITLNYNMQFNISTYKLHICTGGMTVLNFDSSTLISAEETK